MNSKKLQARILGTVVAADAPSRCGRDAKSDAGDRRQATAGRLRPSGPIPANQAEFISTPDAIMSAAASGAPTLIWQALEHGEKVECLDCIGAVAPLLYDANAKNREIAAWWLRRRVFGVFGPGEVYAQTLTTLASDPSATRRGYAANALGEFLVGSGIAGARDRAHDRHRPGRARGGGVARSDG